MAKNEFEQDMTSCILTILHNVKDNRHIYAIRLARHVRVICVLHGNYTDVGMRGLFFGPMSGQQSFCLTCERLFTGASFYTRSLPTDDCCH